MMDLTPVAQAILVYSVLAVGVLATLLTGFAQLRELPNAWKAGPNSALVRRGFLAASVGMGSVGGSILALELGGPGAIGWMWIASLLGMGLVYAEVMLAVRFRRRIATADRDQNEAGTVYALADGIPALRSRALEWLGAPNLISGHSLATLFALVFMVFAIAAGSMLQTQQSGELLVAVGGERWLIAGFLVVAAGVGMAVPKLRNFVVALGPVAVALYVVAVVLMIARSPGDPGAALGSMFAGISSGSLSSEIAGGAAGGGVLMAMQVGFLRATLATEAGIGSAGFTPQADRAKDPRKAAAAAMLAPLVSGIVVPTLTAIVALSSTPWVGQRIDEPGERVAAGTERLASEQELAEIAAALTDGDIERLSPDDRQRVMALWAPLERPQARGTAASLQAGQTVVLPLDAVSSDASDTAAMVEGQVYPMVMRASPRGMKVPAREGQNSIVLGFAEETQVIREVVFRDKTVSAGPAYDLRIPVTNEVLGPEDRKFVQLTPVDPEIDLHLMSKVRDGPYVVFGDFHFEGRVVEMFQTRWGVHHALIEVDPDPMRPLSLRTTVSSSAFRGPYFDNGEARPPVAMVAREEFNAPIGARLPMELRPPERGVEIGKLLASGELMTPPWSFLAETDTAVIRHNTDPTKDMLIPVTSELIDGTLRFLSGRRDIADFAKADRWREYTGPYLLPPAYTFEVEVHSGARFPASSSYLSRLGLERNSLTGPLAERRTLVAVHPQKEPQASQGELYEPHPAEVAPYMDGPYVAGGGLGRVGWAARMNVKRGGDLLLATSVLILALTTMIAWAGYGARAADFAFGRGAGVGFGVVFLLAGLAGATLTLLPILRVADYAMLALILLHGLGLIVLLVRARTRSQA
ncbi:Amino-acid carrier protein AlsT [Enhygromyxa salina]|uniref:Amino-acid carrier protein AlsT n=1 Tax=Enhygromyxa salina TaxID=215803 RepID=A0A2S9YHP9_9BACT|nr:alanine:cation symporter family protein [Enhygromyxa salina]PRQ04546.1 Amino-acid carrier protein AlsT [Enhygromyxa salina]